MKGSLVEMLLGITSDLPDVCMGYGTSDVRQIDVVFEPSFGGQVSLCGLTYYESASLSCLREDFVTKSSTMLTVGSRKIR